MNSLHGFAATENGAVVVPANNQGVPFVLSNPGAGVSQDVERLAVELLAAAHAPVGAGAR